MEFQNTFQDSTSIQPKLSEGYSVDTSQINARCIVQDGSNGVA